MNEVLEKLQKEEQKVEEKDLDLGRAQRENEDLTKKNKNLSEKIIEYQSTNERLRKDKNSLEEDSITLQKELD